MYLENKIFIATGTIYTRRYPCDNPTEQASFTRAVLAPSANEARALVEKHLRWDDPYGTTQTAYVDEIHEAIVWGE